MKHWLFLFRPETYQQVQEGHLVGVRDAHRKRFSELAPGDKFVSYISRKRVLDSHGEIAGEPYTSTDLIFPGWQFYTHRCKVEFLETGKQIDARELLWGLSVFDENMKTNPANYLFLKGGFLEITPEDYAWLRKVLSGEWKGWDK